MVSLKELREKVANARKAEAVRKEKKKLEKELFMLENPMLVGFGQGLKSTAKAFGRGTVTTAKGVQSFAVAQREAELKRSKKASASRKPKIRTIPIKKKGQVVGFREVKVKTIKRKRRQEDSRPSLGFGFDF